METKPKPCKGINKAYGVPGCGEPTKHRTFGLCNNCLSDFLFGTDAGKLIMEKRVIPKAKAILKTEQTKSDKAKRLEILSPDGFRKQFLQPCINKIARLIDYGHPCIATGNYGKENGGHYRSVGSNRTTALNLHNIFIQSFESNHFKSGDPIKFRIGLIETFGNDYFEFVDGLIKTPDLKLSKSEMITIYGKAKIVENRLSKSPEKRSNDERLNLRNQINLELGIYSPEYCVSPASPNT